MVVCSKKGGGGERGRGGGGGELFLIYLDAESIPLVRSRPTLFLFYPSANTKDPLLWECSIARVYVLRVPAKILFSWEKKESSPAAAALKEKWE